MAKRSISSRTSRDVVRLLVDRGMTLTRIAETLGVSKSYISRVNAGNRAFTLEHLMSLEKAVGEPLPWLLVKAIPLSSVPPELKPLYQATLRLLAPSEKRRAKRKRAAA